MDGGKPVRVVAVGGGHCSDELMSAFEAGCDTFVTADIKYNEFWDARALGMNLIDAGHFCHGEPRCGRAGGENRRRVPGHFSVKISETSHGTA